jgi:hypothetical protein
VVFNFEILLNNDFKNLDSTILHLIFHFFVMHDPASGAHKMRAKRGESQYELDDNIFSIGIGIDVKHANWNLHGKHELELKLIRKTGIGFGFGFEKQELEY